MLKKIIIYSDDGIISFLQDEKQFVSFIMGKFCSCGHTNNERSSIMSKEKTYLKWYNKVGYGSGVGPFQYYVGPDDGFAPCIGDFTF